MKLSAIALGLGLLVCTAQASAHPAERADRRGDRIEQRLDQRGDRTAAISPPSGSMRAVTASIAGSIDAASKLIGAWTAAALGEPDPYCSAASSSSLSR